MIADEGCWERGCACHSALGSAGVELVAKREWVDLTDAEVDACWKRGKMSFSRAIQQALKEKNSDNEK